MTVGTPETDRILTRALAKAERVLVLSGSATAREAVNPDAKVFTTPDGEPFDAVIVDAASADVTRLRNLTREGGHVVIDFSSLRGPELRRLAPEIVIQLCEAGFAVQEPKEICDNALEFETGVTPPYVIAWKDRFHVRTHQEGDEKEILEMFERSFYSKRPIEHWNWEYRENPYGKLPISLMVDETGKIVVHYAAYYVPVWRKEGSPYPTVSVQICDTMTDVGVRHVGRGHTSLLIRTIRHFYASHAVNKVAFVYGFNTANIRKICVLYIGGKVIDEGVGFWTRSTKEIESRQGFVSRLLGGAFSAAVEPLSPEFDEFFERVAPAYGMLLLRKVEYLNWRYATSAAADYLFVVVRRRGRIEGWSVFRRKDGDLVWVDALFDPHTARSASAEALRLAMQLPLATGAKQLIAWFPEARPEWWTPIVRELGFVREKEPNELAMVAAAFTDPDAWNTLATMYYAAGDSDLY